MAGRVAALAQKTNLKVLGVIENMAFYEQNGDREYIFGRDGGKDLASRLEVPLFGQIPLMKSIREGADSGKPVASDGTEKQLKLFGGIAEAIEKTSRR